MQTSIFATVPSQAKVGGLWTGTASGIKMGDVGGGLLISVDGVALIRMLSVQCVCVCYPALHHKSQKIFFWHRLTRVVLEQGP